MVDTFVSTIFISLQTVLIKICHALNANIGDVMDLIPKREGM